MPGETPSSTMFAFFKRYGISNKDLAYRILSSKASYGGMAPRNRIDEKTFLSREVVHVAPGKHDLSFFADLPSASTTLTGALMADKKTRVGDRSLVQIFETEAADEMCAAMAEWQLDTQLYRNMLTLIAGKKNCADTDRLTMHVLLFVAVGCLGDMQAASALVQQSLERFGGQAFTTCLADGEYQPSETQPSSSTLGLGRVIEGKFKPPIYPLATDQTGTIIGSMVSGKNAINDVEPTVSRQHLQIFRAPDGKWYAVGLGSTNGTVVVRGATRKTVVVEPPRRERGADYQKTAVPIHPSDLLVLAGSTQFLVMDTVMQ